MLGWGFFLVCFSFFFCRSWKITGRPAKYPHQPGCCGEGLHPKTGLERAAAWDLGFACRRCLWDRLTGILDFWPRFGCCHGRAPALMGPGGNAIMLIFAPSAGQSPSCPKLRPRAVPQSIPEQLLLFISPIYLQEPSAETLFPHGEGKPSLESRPAALDYGLYQGGGGLGIKGLCDLMGFRGEYRSQVTFPGVFASMHQPSRVLGWWRSGCPPKAASSGTGGVIFLVLVGGQCWFLFCPEALGFLSILPRQPTITGCGFVPASPIPTWDVPELPPKMGAESWGGRDQAKLR